MLKFVDIECYYINYIYIYKKLYSFNLPTTEPCAYICSSVKEGGAIRAEASFLEMITTNTRITIYKLFIVPEKVSLKKKSDSY